MNTKTEVRPLWSRLLKALLIVTTTVSSSVAIAAPDLVPDDTVQLNPSGTNIEARPASRRLQTVSLDEAVQPGESEEPPGLIEEGPTHVVASDDMLFFDPPLQSSHTAYGAGSFALGALGAYASRPPGAA